MQIADCQFQKYSASWDLICNLHIHGSLKKMHVQKKIFQTHNYIKDDMEYSGVNEIDV